MSDTARTSGDFPGVEGVLSTLQIRDANALLLTVLEATPVFIVGASADLRVLLINRLPNGRTIEGMIGSSLLEFVDVEYRESARRVFEQVLETGNPGHYETRVTRPSGEVHRYDVQVVRTRKRDAGLALIAVASDVSLPRRREQALAESEERLRLVIEATGMAHWEWDLQTDTAQWSPRMHEITGSSVALSERRYLEQLVHPEDRERVTEEMERNRRRGVFEVKPHRIVRSDGNVRWVMTVGRLTLDERDNPARVVGGTIDITHQVAIEEHLRHAQQMEAVGQLAAGIAHNFNNMLAAILPVLGMARSYMPPSRVSLVEEAMAAGTRGAEMVQQLLAFARSRGEKGPRRLESIDECVKRALGVCETAFGRRIVLRSRLSYPSAQVMCEPGQIEQALVHVLLNARDAVLEAYREAPRIDVEVSPASEAEAAIAGGAQGRTFVRVRVRDNGVGMTSEVKQRIFEPFFSTKGPGRGTGLGLATAFATVEEHGGVLRCTTTGPEGSVFDLLLPVAKGAAAHNGLDKAEKAAHKTVLVVDDEAGVREVTALLLEDAGYVVLRAKSASEALKIANEHPEIRLVLLDLGMPKGGGLTVVGALRNALVNARVVGFTGLPPSESDRALLDAIVLKPVKAAELLDHVAVLLDR